MRIHHIGYLVKRLEKARDVFAYLGYIPTGEPVYDEYRDADILFMEKDGYTVELVSPKSSRSVVAGLMKTYKNAPYHICYISGDFLQDVGRMSADGFMQIAPPAPAPALGGREVCFFMNIHIGMVEILDEGGSVMDSVEREREREKAGPACNRYTLAEISVGMAASFSASVTEEKVCKFREISGDVNPLHISEEFAKAKGHPGRVVYGMLTASLYSTLAGVYLPGERCFLWEVDAKFTAPVYIGDELTVSGKVTEVNDRFGFIKLRARVENQTGQTVSRAVITAGVTDGT